MTSAMQETLVECAGSDFARDLADLRELFEDAPVAYHEIDAAGIIRRVNTEECRLLGYPAREILGRPVWQFVEGAECETSRKAIAAKIAGTLPLAPFRRTLVCEGNRTILVEIRDRLIREDSGRAIGIRSALIDVTASAAAHARAFEDRRWLHAVLHSIADAVLVLDTLGAVLYTNPAARRLLGPGVSDPEGPCPLDSFQLAGPGLAGKPGADFVGYLQSPRLATVTRIDERGQLQTLTLRTSPVVDEDGVVIGIVLLLRRAAETPDAPAPGSELHS